MLTIKIDGKPLSVEDAIRGKLPLDTPLACPECNSRMVEAFVARTIEQIGGESKAITPRMQERRCLGCGHRWESVLPPAIFNDPLFQRRLGR